MASLTMRRANVHLDTLTTAHALLPGVHWCSLLSLGGCQSYAMLQNWLQSCAQPIGCSLLSSRTVCWVIYYLNHTGRPSHPPNASFLYAVSPHISEQNCTSWQWCFLIFSTRVNLVKQDGPRFHKYPRRKLYCYRSRTSLLVLYTGFKGSILQ